MATLAPASPPTPLSPFSPSSPSTPTQAAAEALLSRARQLSSNAYERALPAAPLAFAEGEEVHASSPTLSPTTPSMQHHTRSSFQDYIKDPSRRGSSSRRPVSSSSVRSGASATSGQTPETTDSSATGEFLFHGVDASTESAHNDAHTPPACPTSGSPMMRHSLTITTRPRAMTLEAIRETKENTTAPTTTTKDANSSATSTLLSPMDLHRKHRSENGSGLVLGVLEALRDGEHSGVRQTNSKGSAGLNAAQNDSASIAPVTTTAATATGISPYAVANADCTFETKVDSAFARTAPFLTVTNVGSPETAHTLENAPSATAQKASSGAGVGLQHDLDAASKEAPSAETKTTDEERPAPPPKLQQDQSQMRSPMVSTTTASLRRASQSDSIYIQDNSDIVSVSTTNTAASVSSSSKASRRTSKLFGKLVPKFLQTNFSPSTAGGASSPQSAYPASSSPMSAMARPTRSASFAAGSSRPLVTLSSVEEVAAEAARRTELPSIPALPSLPVSVVRNGEDWLGANEDRRSRHSASSDSIPEEQESPLLDPSRMETLERPTMPPQTTSFKSVHSTRSMQSQGAVSTPTETSSPGAFKMQIDRDQDDSRHSESKMTDRQDDTQKQISNGQGSRSPYIIDEDDCDDDFFRKSVLRKSARPQPPPMLQTGWEMHGSERTPSLSTATSSQASSVSGSPTSPMPSMFTPSSTPVTTSTPHPQHQQHQQHQQHLHHNSHQLLQFHKEYRATTTQQQQQQQPGLDEKRSRLRNAVGEWRRSSSHSSGSMMSPTPHS
ncbi:hypothetical protein EMPS_09586 [Entomortierella parvispora]|uniref:Uncharacterized protein n=1 Tax=Entomortierella parvispora TaxID=205924 RepID=A0A9P3M0I2_9FUNG|nr:hypothetical protein EMPS_09586 [Entomortierella parvispora]